MAANPLIAQRLTSNIGTYVRLYSTTLCWSGLLNAVYDNCAELTTVNDATTVLVDLSGVVAIETELREATDV